MSVPALSPKALLKLRTNMVNSMHAKRYKKSDSDFTHKTEKLVSTMIDISHKIQLSHTMTVHRKDHFFELVTQPH